MNRAVTLNRTVQGGMEDTLDTKQGGYLLQAAPIYPQEVIPDQRQVREERINHVGQYPRVR